MQEKILEILKKENIALSVQEINDKLNLSSVDNLKELLKNLNELEDNLKVYRSKKDKYLLFNNSHLQIGKFLATKKDFGFVDVEGDNDIFISEKNVNNAIQGDKVVVEIISSRGINKEGRIVRIVNRDLSHMVGEYVLDPQTNNGTIILDDSKIKISIVVNHDNSKGALTGHKVVVKLKEKLKDNTYNGEVVKILGHKNDPGVDILSIVHKLGIKDEFDEAVMDEVEKIPDYVLEEEYIGRRDLREEVIFTIDGDDTKDIDDAISIEKLSNGNYKLGVHIADISHYVKENTKLDEEAELRGTSVYLADRVIPMLPHKLSNGICSLNPGVDRLAVSCVMEIDNGGKVIDADIFESVLRSEMQMTYKKVNQILEENIIPEGYQKYAEALYQMKDLADILRKMKEKRGYIDFEIEESKIVVNDDGEAIDVVLRERGVGEKIIEDFMIVANETVATHIYYMELPFIYRVHGKPSEEKINQFMTFLKVLGYHVDMKIKEINPSIMQKILENLKEKKEFHILSSLLLRSMQKAIYDAVNIGHFGLASKCYTHFTAPIRRYPDTTVHRLLRKYLFKHQIDKNTIAYWEQRLPVLAEQCSLSERTSIECEREVDDMKKAEYMEKHIGEEFDGMISSVMSFGIFVELPNLVEGLVRVDDMRDDHYIYDENTFSLVGRSTKKRYRLGDNLRIKVKAASKENKTVDFIIVNPNKEKEN